VVKIRYETKEEGRVYLDAGKIEKGKLTLNLPEPPDAALEPVDLPDSVTISPKDIKILTISSLYVFVGNEATPSFRVAYHKDNGDVWDDIIYMYSPQAATVTGTFPGSNDDGWTWTETYNLNLKQGWNAVYAQEAEKEAEKTATVTYTTDGSGMPSGMKWVLSPPR
jgi:hypothetical protein